MGTKQIKNLTLKHSFSVYKWPTASWMDRCVEQPSNPWRQWRTCYTRAIWPKEIPNFSQPSSTSELISLLVECVLAKHSTRAPLEKLGLADKVILSQRMYDA